MKTYILKNFAILCGEHYPAKPIDILWKEAGGKDYMDALQSHIDGLQDRMDKMEILLTAHVPNWEEANIFQDKPMMTEEDNMNDDSLVSVITKVGDEVYFEWQCPRCGAVLSSTDEHCPCRFDNE